MAGAATVTDRETLRKGVRFVYLGVEFQANGWDRSAFSFIAPRQAEMTTVMEDFTAPFRTRQKRGRLMFWDAMTYLGRAFPKSELLRRPEGAAFLRMLASLADAQVNGEAASAMLGIGALASLRRNVRELPLPSGGRSSRGMGVPGPGDSWRITPEGLALVRTLSLELPADSADPSQLDWIRVTMLAVLAHLQSELELWIDTAFIRVRLCPQCESWFEARRMAGRQSFCSASCRVTSSRTPVKR